MIGWVWDRNGRAYSMWIDGNQRMRILWSIFLFSLGGELGPYLSPSLVGLQLIDVTSSSSHFKQAFRTQLSTASALFTPLPGYFLELHISILKRRRNHSLGRFAGGQGILLV
jgi:hypothetical protein